MGASREVRRDRAIGAGLEARGGARRLRGGGRGASHRLSDFFLSCFRFSAALESTGRFFSPLSPSAPASSSAAPDASPFWAVAAACTSVIMRAFLKYCWYLRGAAASTRRQRQGRRLAGAAARCTLALGCGGRGRRLTPP